MCREAYIEFMYLQCDQSMMAKGYDTNLLTETRAIALRNNYMMYYNLIIAW